MSDELVFTITDAGAVKATPISLKEAGFTERADLQKWAIANPEILGPNIMILTEELGRWVSGKGADVKDRLDILGLDSDGSLVVAELKRDVAPDPTAMQAVKYAAMASGLSLSELVSYHHSFHNKTNPDDTIDEEEAMSRIVSHAPDVDDESLKQLSIVLLATGFPPTVTSTAMFLSSSGLTVTLMELNAYRLSDNQLTMSVSQLYPLPDIDELAISGKPLTARKQAQVSQRETRTATRLVQGGVVQDGTRFEISPPTHKHGPALMDWIAEDSSRGCVTWRNDKTRPLVWEVDGQPYSLSGLVVKLFDEAVGIKPEGIGGALWWHNREGRRVIDLLDDLAE